MAECRFWPGAPRRPSACHPSQRHGISGDSTCWPPSQQTRRDECFPENTVSTVSTGPRLRRPRSARCPGSPLTMPNGADANVLSRGSQDGARYRSTSGRTGGRLTWKIVADIEALARSSDGGNADPKSLPSGQTPQYLLVPQGTPHAIPIFVDTSRPPTCAAGRGLGEPRCAVAR
jgi:hypothetical protein